MKAILTQLGTSLLVLEIFYTASQGEWILSFLLLALFIIECLCLIHLLLNAGR